MIQTLIQDATLHLVLHLRKCRLRQFLRLSLFWWTWQFWGVLVKYLVESLSIWIVLMFFWGCVGFGKETIEVKCHSHHLISRVHTTHVTYHWKLWAPDWGSTCQLSPLWSYSFFLLYILYALEEVTMCSPHRRCGSYAPSPSWRSGCINYLEFCMKDVSTLNHLCIYPIFIYINMDSSTFYFILWVII